MVLTSATVITVIRKSYFPVATTFRTDNVQVDVSAEPHMDMECPVCPSSNQNGCVLDPLHVSEPKQVVAPPCLRVHLYHLGRGRANSPDLTYPSGNYVAEELCIDAAMACGLSPMYCSLFGLMRESDRMWFPPNHILKLDESANEMLLFRVR